MRLLAVVGVGTFIWFYWRTVMPTVDRFYTRYSIDRKPLSRGFSEIWRGFGVGARKYKDNGRDGRDRDYNDDDGGLELHLADRQHPRHAKQALQRRVR